MKKETNDNTYGIKEYAKKRNQETYEKVNLAIKHLKRSKNKKINFKTVAEQSGVSIATLYNNQQIRERIEGLRALQKAEKQGETSVDEVLSSNQLNKEKIKAMYNEIKQLKEDKKNLIAQLVDMEELKIENKNLRKKLDKIVTL
jgi:hypothetical protein